MLNMLYVTCFDNVRGSIGLFEKYLLTLESAYEMMDMIK